MNFFKKIDAIVSKGARDISGKHTSKKSLFRELTNKEKLSSEVFDFRNVMGKNPNNNVIITCEHASNNLFYLQTQSDKEKEFLQSHWGYDIGARDLAIELAESAEVFSVCTNFSRLIIDPNRSLLSDTLIRETVEKDFKLSFNENCN